jgi:hypothetical protein
LRFKCPSNFRTYCESKSASFQCCKMFLATQFRCKIASKSLSKLDACTSLRADYIMTYIYVI